MDQAKVYLRQNPNDANLTISELKSIINSGNSMQLLQRMSAYSSNVTGCDSYWHKRRCELEATFEQKPPATVFFTFSYADNHWNDLHRLMPQYFGNDNTIKDQSKYQDVIANPHLVDWYFSHRLNNFLECVFDKILDCEWRWHRFEWQSRTAIHAHGAARFRNDPGLIELTKRVYIAHLHKKQSIGKVFNNTDEIIELEKIIEDGVIAEKKIITYTDTLITAMNMRLQNGEILQLGVPDPHPCSYRTASIDPEKLDNDYNDITNCCQRHVCRLDGYCKSKKGDNKCRFGYPFKIEPVTRMNIE